MTAASDSDDDAADDDIEAQIKRELEGLKPGAPTHRPFQAIKFETACCESPVSAIRKSKADKGSKSKLHPSREIYRSGEVGTRYMYRGECQSRAEKRAMAKANDSGHSNQKGIEFRP